MYRGGLWGIHGAAALYAAVQASILLLVNQAVPNAYMVRGAWTTLLVVPSCQTKQDLCSIQLAGSHREKVHRDYHHLFPLSCRTSPFMWARPGGTVLARGGSGTTKSRRYLGFTLSGWQLLSCRCGLCSFYSMKTQPWSVALYVNGQ